MHETMGLLANVMLFAVEREKAILSAFAVLIGAGIVVSVAAWILLRREVRGARGEPEHEQGHEQEQEQEQPQA